MASPSMPTNSVVLNLVDSYGPMLIGALLSCAAWGLSGMQMFLYFQNYDADHWALKVFVVSLWAIDTASQFLNVATLWPALIAHWASLGELSVMHVAALHRSWLVAIITFSVQMYYFRRIYRFSGRRLLFPLLLAPFALWQLVMIVIFLAWLFEDIQFSTLYTPRVFYLEVSARASTAFVDISIMVAMIYLLLQHRRSEFRRSRKLISRLVVITVNTGLWTTLATILELTLLVMYRDGIQFSVIEYPLSSLYLNALLANVNSRESIGKTINGIHSCEFASGIPGSDTTLRIHSIVDRQLADHTGSDKRRSITFGKDNTDTAMDDDHDKDFDRDAGIAV